MCLPRYLDSIFPLLFISPSLHLLSPSPCSEFKRLTFHSCFNQAVALDRTHHPALKLFLPSAAVSSRTPLQIFKCNFSLNPGAPGSQLFPYHISPMAFSLHLMT